MDDNTTDVNKNMADKVELDTIVTLVTRIRLELNKLGSDNKRERVWRYVKEKFDEEIYPQRLLNVNPGRIRNIEMGDK